MQQKVDFIQQLARISSMAGPRISKALPKAQLAPLFDGLSRFDALQLLNPSENTTSEKYTQQIDEMH